MARVKRGKIAHKRRKKLLKHAKGFRWGRKSKYRLAKEALFHAWTYSYRDRRTKKESSANSGKRKSMLLAENKEFLTVNLSPD